MEVTMQEFFKNIYQYINPPQDPDLSAANQQWESQLPTLWLIGKTGAGKSTLIETLTGNDSVEIGNGFQPCTQTSLSYQFPEDNPILRFLDTRGLSEASYDPAEDIAACQQQSHALIVVMKAEEPSQQDVLTALSKIRKDGRIKNVLLVHTGCLSLSDASQREQAIGYNHDQVEKAWGASVTAVQVDFLVQPEGADLPYGVDRLQEQLAELLPVLYLLEGEQLHHDAEQRNFAKLQREIMWYAGSAGASDALPAVGLVSVPAIQGKMLHSLGRHYGVVWNRQRFTEFAGLMGGSFVANYVVQLGARQLTKFIPVYGQTVGSALSVAMSFGMTYAIGRAACKYLYHISKGEPVSSEAIKAVFEQALKQVKESQKRNEKNKK
ncbi:kinase [Photobacterium aphoticum]|nr:kinase [Photobacterium aphoticum]